MTFIIHQKNIFSLENYIYKILTMKTHFYEIKNRIIRKINFISKLYFHL